jgi:cell fate regulator YaaT (PSP1 superfamily)
MPVAMNEPIYLVRFGAMSHIGTFRAAGSSYERDQTVIIRSSRGTELGQVLARAPVFLAQPPQTSCILRAAQAPDLERAHRARADHTRRFEICERVFQNGIWPLTLIDVEPLLDEGRTVLYYVGPHGLDASGLTGQFLDHHGLEIVLEPIGRELLVDAFSNLNRHSSCDRGDCGTCSDAAGHDCGGCALKDALSTRSRTYAPRSPIPAT